MIDKTTFTVPHLIYFGAMAVITAWLAWPVYLDQASFAANLTAQLLVGVMIIASMVAYPVDRGSRPRRLPLQVQAAIFCGAGVAVQIVFTRSQLLVLLFFILFPLSTYARRQSLVWIPGLFLIIPGSGRFLLHGDWQLLAWAAGFGLFSVVTGYTISREDRKYEKLSRQVIRHQEDARGIMDRIQENEADKVSRYSRAEMAHFVTLMEDRFLKDLLIWGCRVFQARTGVLLVPMGPGYFRIRSGATLVKGGLIEEPLPSEKGFIHIARQRGGVLCLSDARSSTHASSIYQDRDTPVGSLLVKVIHEQDREGREKAGDEAVHSVLYFDHQETEAFEMDDHLEKWLAEYAKLVVRALEMMEMLQRVGSQMSSKDALAKYARKLTSTLEPEKIAHIALDAVREAIPASNGVAVFTFDKSLTLLAGSGCGLETLAGTDILRSESSQLGLVLRKWYEVQAGRGGNGDGANGEQKSIGTFLHHRQEKPSPFFHKREKVDRIVSFAAVPSIMQREDGTRELKAVLAAVSPEPEVFGAEEMDDLRMVANVLSPALDNAAVHLQVQEMSRIDGLTGLLNHRVFQETLEHRFLRIDREYDSSFAVLMVDGDKFKNINDTYGHPVGDEVLKELAVRLRNGVRALDTVARYGGEEFAIILDKVSEKETRNIAEKLRESIASQPFKTAAGKLKVTASLGFALHRAGDSIHKQELLERADKALYAAKNSGRNTVRAYVDIAGQLADKAPVADEAIQGG
jgi:diguanylate cyclase (GGDEF)-like protein